jgi:osmoprotectant transport system substrate-binding protein
MDLGLLYQALDSGRIEMAAANATDGALARQEFTVLEDDLRYFPPYECAVVVRDTALTQHAGLGAALEELSAVISDETMRRMNAAVDRDKRPVAEVAAEFLRAISSR